MSAHIYLALVVLGVLTFSFLVRNSVTAQLSGIDIFTQKEPFSGRGENVASDAFHPGEPVTLFARVFVSGAPISNQLVTFQVLGPSNNTGTLFERVAETNETGLASIMFTIPSTDNETHIFGNWTVIGCVEINEVCSEDSLIFRVGWIVKIISLRTIDDSLSNRNLFGVDGDVGVEIAFQSISMIEKKATFSLVIQDSLNVPVTFLRMDDLLVQPNETTSRMYCVLHLPKWATIGGATLHSAALTAAPSLGGIPYSPGVNTSFAITTTDPLSIRFDDVAVVKVNSKDSVVNSGESTSVNVTVRNEGSQDENFTLNIYYDSNLIDSISVESLNSYTQRELSITWNTSNVYLGNYTLSASIPSLTNEIETTDNTYIDGIVRIQIEPTPKHDIAVVLVTSSPTTVNAGNPVYINVTVKNKENQIESFNVTTYYNLTNIIDTVLVEFLHPNSEQTIFFVWDTGGVASGNYTLSGYAHPVVGEEAIFDNYLVDGVVTVLPVGVLHDLSVLEVSAWPSEVEVGGEVFVDVVVRNNGSLVEVFNVTAYFDDVEISTFLVDSLVSGGELTVNFVWDTGGVASGNYVIKANITPVPGETAIEDNIFVNGIVEVKSPSPKLLVPDWIIAALTSLFLLLILFLIMTLLKRRKKNEGLEESFTRAWKAWFERSPMNH
ncbi:MAG: hypothetical protein NWE78_06320 [Candidatus Bathyarchaeota archaeon]|nr:hypothetical protein [Candidatus Bathyarchaeota archaeon]